MSPHEGFFSILTSYNFKTKIKRAQSEHKVGKNLSADSVCSCLLGCILSESKYKILIAFDTRDTWNLSSSHFLSARLIFRAFLAY